MGQKPDDQRAKEILARDKQYADAFNVRHDTIYRIGTPVENIISATREGNYSLIIIGSTERHYLYKKLVGGTADQVIGQAPCNVLVVKMK